MKAPRENDLCVLNMSVASSSQGTILCFVTKASEKESVFWHRRMGHNNVRKMNYLVHNQLVEWVNVKSFHFSTDGLSCKKGKQKKKSHPTKSLNSINLPLERVHMELLGPANVKSITGELYCLVLNDDYSCFSWVMFLESKDETFNNLMVLFKNFENDPYTPQQNGVAKCKNMTLIETARAMLDDSYATPIQRKGDSWMIDYDNLWSCFSFLDEEITDEMATLLFQQHLGEGFHEDNTTQDVPIFNTDPVPNVDELVDDTPAYKKALTEESWVNALTEELLQFEKLVVWKLVDLPDDKRCINTKWVFKCKRDGNGIIVRNKARLVVLGFNQREGIDYNEVYALVARLEAIRSLRRTTTGFVDPINNDKEYLLDKALYILHQAPRAWYDTLSQHVQDNSFVRGTVDCTLFTKEVDGHLLKDQTKYVKDILEKYNIADSMLISTPIPLNHGIGPDPTEEKVDETLYHSMIGSVMYLIASRPNIMYPTCLCARYESNPRVSHLSLVKRILRYLKGCPGVGLWYPRDDVFELRAYSDSDYGSCKLNAKLQQSVVNSLLNGIKNMGGEKVSDPEIMDFDL
ncbi:uncharacterized protein LOC143545961 [Bidens hawaiensis]|uniref:uncharacterized protein LOC143545961 n=1 Tax=Bidens hawaiensis TaxID=980011 RepID=UPI00404920D9